MSRAESAAAFLAIRQALGVKTLDNPCNSDQAARSALAEAISDHSSGANGFDLTELLCLARHVLQYRDDACGPNPAVYDLDSLCETVGNRSMCALALRLCGAYVRDNVWQDDGVGDPVALDFDNFGSME